MARARTLAEFLRLERRLHRSRRHCKALKAIYRGISEQVPAAASPGLTLSAVVRGALARTLAPAAAAEFSFAGNPRRRARKRSYSATKCCAILRGIIKKRFGSLKPTMLHFNKVTGTWLAKQAYNVAHPSSGGDGP